MRNLTILAGYNTFCGQKRIKRYIESLVALNSRINSPRDLNIRTLLASRATAASALHIVTSALPKIHIHYTHKRAPFYGCLLCLALARLHHEIHLGINYHILVS